jgi:drug/metabolite transporter (DMT)-like permease
MFWGLSWPLAKYLVTFAPPFTVGFFRFLIACVFFAPILVNLYKAKKFRKETVKLFLILGLTGIFGYGVFFLIGLQFTTAAEGSIIAGINPITISLFSHIFFQERLAKPWQYSGFLISLLGIVFVIGVKSILDFQIEHILGNMLILAAMGCWGIYTNVSKKGMMSGLSSFEVTAGSILFGMILFSIGAVTENYWLDPTFASFSFWLPIFILGFFTTFVSFSFYFVSVNRIGPTRSGIFINLVPIFGILFSAFFLNETIHWTFFIGLLLIFLGIGLINYPTKKSMEINPD